MALAKRGVHSWAGPEPGVVRASFIAKYLLPIETKGLAG